MLRIGVKGLAIIRIPVNGTGKTDVFSIRT